MRFHQDKKIVFAPLFLLMIAGCLFLLSRLGIFQGMYPRGGGNDITTELRKLSLEIVENSGQANERILFSGDPRERAFWDQQVAACKQGGYNLTKYAGQNAVYTSYIVKNKVYQSSGGQEYPLTVRIITIDNKVICVYGTVTELIPGVLSIMDPFIKRG